jgi:hypothetical protein
MSFEGKIGKGKEREEKKENVKKKRENVKEKNFYQIPKTLIKIVSSDPYLDFTAVMWIKNYFFWIRQT